MVSRDIDAHFLNFDVDIEVNIFEQHVDAFQFLDHQPIAIGLEPLLLLLRLALGPDDAVLVDLLEDGFIAGAQTPAQKDDLKVVQWSEKLDPARAALFIGRQIFKSEHGLELGNQLRDRLQDLWTELNDHVGCLDLDFDFFLHSWLIEDVVGQHE